MLIPIDTNEQLRLLYSLHLDSTRTGGPGENSEISSVLWAELVLHCSSTRTDDLAMFRCTMHVLLLHAGHIPMQVFKISQKASMVLLRGCTRRV